MARSRSRCRAIRTRCSIGSATCRCRATSSRERLARPIAIAIRRCSRPQPGAVAAPTAGFHMTPAIAERMTARGIAIATVTLHVGYGTFEPIRVDDIREHHMHRERYVDPRSDGRVDRDAAGRSSRSARPPCARSKRRAASPAPARPTSSSIRARGTTFLAHHLITNFHLPESTLLMLVCAFAGTERVLAAYRHAVAQRYRFFSYGDAMLVHRDKSCHESPDTGLVVRAARHAAARRAPASCTRRAATSRRRCSCRSAPPAPSRR